MNNNKCLKYEYDLVYVIFIYILNLGVIKCRSFYSFIWIIEDYRIVVYVIFIVFYNIIYFLFLLM